MLSISLEVAGLLCLIILQPVFAQYNRATSVEVQNGKPTAWWSEGPKAGSTSIEVISPLPTIYYNCHYAGSLCNNVELTQTGAHAGTIDMELVYDKDAKRKKKRREGNCPSKWNKNHVCPEVDQPDVWTIDSSRNPKNSDGTPDKSPKKLSTSLQNAAASTGGKRLKYLIADYTNDATGTLTPSGLMYTCDEFPFASTIQGGNGLKGDSNAGLMYSAATYCAPQSSRCANDLTWQTSWLTNNNLLSAWQALPPKTVRSKWLKDHEIDYPSSDQNEQAKALSALANLFSKLNGDLFLFKLKTINNPKDLRFAYMDTGEEEDGDGDDDGDGDEDGEDESDDDDTNTKRDLAMPSKDKESHTNSTTHHGRDLGIGFSLGLGTGGFGVGASIALGHHSRPQTSSSTPTHNPEVIAASSGFVSITRPGTGASIVTGSSVKPRPIAENGSYAVPIILSPSSLGSVTTLPTLSLVSTVLKSSSVLSQNGSGTFTDAPKPVTVSASDPSTTIASQSNSSIVSDLTTTLYPATSSHYHYGEHKWWRELNLLKRRSRCLYHFGEPDGSGAHVIYFSSSILTAPRTQYNHKRKSDKQRQLFNYNSAAYLGNHVASEETTITPNPTTTKDRTITFPPITTTDMVSFSQVTIQNPGDKIIPVPVIDLPKPITLTDEKPPATITPQVTVRLPVLPPIALETPPPPTEPSSTPVPPPPDSNDDDGTEDEEDDEDDDDEEEEGEDDEHCYVPGFDPSDFPSPDEESLNTAPSISIFGAQCYFFRAGSEIDDIRPSTTSPFINHRATAATSAINI
ncbi:hypothetical protein KCV07_g7387, partial [Aureobasidium melanogenum]